MTAESYDPVYRPPREIIMRAELGSDSPFWTTSGRYVDLENLPITACLKQQLRDWTQELERLGGDDDSPAGRLSWIEVGRSLHGAVAEELGPEFDLVLDA